jgi:hypothetical protein
LGRKHTKELGGIGKVTFTSGKEEAPSKAILTIQFLGNRASNGGLSRTGHPIQPKYTLIT